MLSAAASNTLLKTLEEPPPHVVFVLATTDPHKVLPTIRSRTQHFEFTLLSAEQLRDHLTDILGREGVAADAEVLDLIVAPGRRFRAGRTVAARPGARRRRRRARHARGAGRAGWRALRPAAGGARSRRDRGRRGCAHGRARTADPGPRRPPRRRRSVAHDARRVHGRERGRAGSLRRSGRGSGEARRARAGDGQRAARCAASRSSGSRSSTSASRRSPTRGWCSKSRSCASRDAKRARASRRCSTASNDWNGSSRRRWSGGAGSGSAAVRPRRVRPRRSPRPNRRRPRRRARANRCSARRPAKEPEGGGRGARRRRCCRRWPRRPRPSRSTPTMSSRRGRRCSKA